MENITKFTFELRLQQNMNPKVWKQPEKRKEDAEILKSIQYCIASKINVTPKGVYLPISKLHSILAVANLLAHNNKSQICYCGQISLQSAAVNCSFSDTFGGNIYFAGDGAS